MSRRRVTDDVHDHRARDAGVPASRTTDGDHQEVLALRRRHGQARAAVRLDVRARADARVHVALANDDEHRCADAGRIAAADVARGEVPLVGDVARDDVDPAARVHDRAVTDVGGGLVPADLVVDHDEDRAADGRLVGRRGARDDELEQLLA